MESEWTAMDGNGGQCHGMPINALACHAVACQEMPWHDMACQSKGCHGQQWTGMAGNADLQQTKRVSMQSHLTNAHIAGPVAQNGDLLNNRKYEVATSHQVDMINNGKYQNGFTVAEL